jgi:glycosyltransferase
MKISVITVCFNSASTLETTIKSVENQTHPNIEYIIIDGGSTDDSLKIIKQYDSVISKWVSEPDKGLYDAMNKGILMSSGDIVALINSDDLFCDNKALEKIAKTFTEQTELDSVYADLFYVDQKDTDKIVKQARRKNSIRVGTLRIQLFMLKEKSMKSMVFSI